MEMLVDRNDGKRWEQPRLSKLSAPEAEAGGGADSDGIGTPS